MTETLELDAQSTALTTQALSISSIAGPEEYTSAAELGTVLAGFQKSIEEYWEPLCDAAHKAHKAVTTRRKEMLEPVEKARRQLDSVIKKYLAEVERQRKAQEDAIRAQAKREADERALREAEALLSAGNPEAAERVIDNQILAAPPPVIVPSSTPQVKGMSVRTTWKARVIDESQVPREYLVVDQSKLDAVMKATKGKMRIPGVEAYEDKGLAYRA